jgi:hypothetical protein
MRYWALLWLLPAVCCAPNPAALPAPTRVVVAAARRGLTTPAPSLDERDISDITNAVGSYVDGIISGLGSGVSSFVASGVPDYFQDLPTKDKVKEEVGASDEQLAAKPIQVLNVP